MSKESILIFTKTMAALLHSGVTLQESLQICGSAERKIKPLCDDLSRQLYEGIPLHKAIFSTKYANFSNIYIALLKIGEQSGSVEIVFLKLTQYLEKKRDMSRKIKQALLYPALVCFMTVAVCVFIIIYIFPKLREIILAFSTSTEVLEQKLASISFGMVTTAILLIAIFIFIFVLIILRKNSKEALLFEDRLILSLPLIGKAMKTYCTRDFTFSMELLTASGVSLVQALTESESVVQNSWYSHEIIRLKDEISEGVSFASAASHYHVFPPYIVTWFVIGEKTGNVHSVFEQLHRYYDNENDTMINGIISATEPLFILLAGGLLFLLVFQFVLPIFSILGGL